MSGLDPFLQRHVIVVTTSGRPVGGKLLEINKDSIRVDDTVVMLHAICTVELGRFAWAADGDDDSC